MPSPRPGEEGYAEYLAKRRAKYNKTPPRTCARETCGRIFYGRKFVKDQEHYCSQWCEEQDRKEKR